MHHPHFLPARFFEFLNHVDAAACIIKLLRKRGEHTDKAIADLHAEQYDKCVAWHIANRPDGWVLFDDWTTPGANDNTDHLLVGPGGCSSPTRGRGAVRSP